MPQLTEQQICEEGWRKANVLISEAVMNATPMQMNNNLDVLRHTCLSVLAIDLANATKQFDWTAEQMKDHLRGLMGVVVDLAAGFDRKIDAGETHFEKSKEFEQ